jgi:hypothetical protein
LIEVNCEKTVSVNVNSELSLTCPSDKDLACGASSNPSNTGSPTVPDNGCGVTLMYIDTIYRTWVAIDACGLKKTCRQVIRVDTCEVSNTARKSTTETITSAPVITSPVKTIKDRPVISPATTSFNTGKRSTDPGFSESIQ